MDVFAHNDYRQILRHFIEESKKAGSSLNYSKLAAVMGIQKSYLSQALAGRCYLSPDQLYKAAQYMKLADLEKDYLLLLLEHSRTRLDDRRSRLHQQLERIRAEKIGKA